MRRCIGKRLRTGCAAAVLAALAGLARTVEPGDCTDDAILVFDGSGSMSEMGFGEMAEPRIFDARRAMRRALPQVAPVRRLGLLVYGPGPKDACSNVDLRFAPVRDAAPRILAELEALQPAGQTPLTVSVRRAAEALGAPGHSGIVVLVTDGKETCGGAPCLLAAELAANAPGLVVHVIGFRVRSDFFEWSGEGQETLPNGTTVARCLADRTGGMYVSTETVDELTAALQQTLGCMVIGRGIALTPPPV